MVATKYTSDDPPSRTGPAAGGAGGGPPTPADALPRQTARALRRLMEERGLSQRQVAEELSVTEATVSRWLARRQGMPMRTLSWFAGRLEVPLEFLFREGGPERAISTPAEALTALSGQFEHLLRSLRTVPLYRWASAGDPRLNVPGEMAPVAYQQLPPGHEYLAGGRAFALSVEQDTVAGRGVYPGDVLLVNPDAPWHRGSLVVALVEDRLVAQEVAVDANGRTVLRTVPEAGPGEVTPGDAFVIVGTVVLVQAVRPLPGGLGNASERPTRERRGETRLDYMNKTQDDK